MSENRQYIEQYPADSLKTNSQFFEWRLAYQTSIIIGITIMLLMKKNSQTMNKNIFTIDIVIYAVFWFIFFYDFYPWLEHTGFGDFEIYKRAVVAYLQGKNAYKPEIQQHLFVYNPIVLHFFAYIEQIFGFTRAVVGVYVLVTAWLVFELKNCFPRLIDIQQLRIAKTDSKQLLLILAGWFAFGGIGFGCFFTGNVTLYLHFLLLATLLGFYRSRALSYKIGFMLCVFIFSLIKPYFLAYLGLLFLLFESKIQVVFYGFVIVSLTALSWFGSMQFYPAEFQEFMEALHKQSLIGHDIGYSFFGIAIKAGMTEFNALLMHSALSITLLISAWRDESKSGGKSDLAAKLLLFYSLLTLVNPRMKEYDLFPALLSFFLLLQRNCKYSKSIMLAGIMISIIPCFSYLVAFSGLHLPGVFNQNHTWQLFGLVLMAVMYKVFSHSRNYQNQ
jgi:hypothetical protein